ncbi:hypothetical protein I5G61_gp53 [Mycobacterium phage Quesadilla]|uniref:Uncharacterized protein n=1 Tax=Mycobacterium phage Quesadilla TaxID=2664226 RepID=A0A5Q2W9U7_9CAUD|nr:hypothetical protein I5G61_gp53 [Mycobacterium phage Quesadilla]QGH75301.1 hypothetical protein SEA_QUESADILLA_53 [Mycobacterium phage Quesadilla]
MSAEEQLGPIAQAFERFHDANPKVYDVLVQMARAWRATGRERCGVQQLFERARWEIAMTTVGDEYKINNNFAAFYARLIMWNEPDLDGMFSCRSSEADEWVRIRTAE